MPSSLLNSSTTPKHGHTSRPRSPPPQPIYYPVPLIDLPIRTSTKLVRSNVDLPGFRLLRRISKSCLKIVSANAITDTETQADGEKRGQQKREEVVKRKLGGDVELSKVKVRVTEKRGSESTEEDGKGLKSEEKEVWEIRKIWTPKRPRHARDVDRDGECCVGEIRSEQQTAQSHQDNKARNPEHQHTAQHKKQNQTIQHPAWKSWWKQLLFEKSEPDTYWKPLPPDPPLEDTPMPTKQRVGQVILKEKSGVPTISCIPTAVEPQYHYSSWPLNPPSLPAENDVGATTEATEIAKSLTRAINRTPSLVKKEKGVQKLRAQATDAGIEGKRRAVEGEELCRMETARRDGNETEERKRRHKQIRKDVRRHIRSKALDTAPMRNGRDRPPPAKTIPRIDVTTCEQEEKTNEQTKEEVQKRMRSGSLNRTPTITSKDRAPPVKSRPGFKNTTRKQKDKKDEQVQSSATVLTPKPNTFAPPKTPSSQPDSTTLEQAQKQAQAEQSAHNNTLVDELVSAINQHIRLTEQRLTILSPTMEYDELLSSPNTSSVNAVREKQS